MTTTPEPSFELALVGRTRTYLKRAMSLDELRRHADGLRRLRNKAELTKNWKMRDACHLAACVLDYMWIRATSLPGEPMFELRRGREQKPAELIRLWLAAGDFEVDIITRRKTLLGYATLLKRAGSDFSNDVYMVSCRFAEKVLRYIVHETGLAKAREVHYG